MKFLPQTNKDQIMLLPLSINDFVEDSHIVRTIDEIIERLDTKAIESQYSELGRLCEPERRCWLSKCQVRVNHLVQM